MKKIIMIISASFLMLACNDNSKKEIQKAKTMAIDSMKMVSKINETKRTVIDSMKMQTKIESENQLNKELLKNAEQTNVYVGKKYSSPKAEGYIVKNHKNDAFPSPTSDEDAPIYKPIPEKKKRKISRPVEGAIIGAGVGAVSGAIINKNDRGKGAIIGGIIGAGIGAGAGVLIDNKEKNHGN